MALPVYEQKKRKYLLAINGGHFEASARLFEIEEDQRDDKLIPFHFDFPLNNHAIDKLEFRSRLDLILTEISASVDLSIEDLNHHLVRVVISFPGAGLTHDQRQCRAVVDSVLTDVQTEILDDTWAGLYAHTLTRIGICAYAGAGASVAISTGEFSTLKVNKIDGWGPHIGDFGSAFYIVMKYFRNLGRLNDRGRRSALFPVIQEYTSKMIQIPSVEGVQPWFDSFVRHYATEWRSNFARIAIPILAAGDLASCESKSNARQQREARRLIVGAAEAMCKSISLAIDRHPQEMPIVLQGGVFHNSKLYTKTVKRLVYIEHDRIAELSCRRTVEGALLLAANQIGFQERVLSKLSPN